MVYVVPEGAHAGNKFEKDRRAAAAAAAMKKGEFSHALSVPDCLIELVRNSIDKLERVTWWHPPAEGEAAVMALLRGGLVGSGSAAF